MVGAKNFFSLFHPVEVKYTIETFSDYLTAIDQLHSKVTPMDVTGGLLHPKFTNVLPLADTLPTIIVSNGAIDDFCLYQATRWARDLLWRTPLVIVPLVDLQDSSNLKLLADWLAPKVHSTGLTLASQSIDIKDLKPLTSAIKSALPANTVQWSIDICRCNFPVIVPEVSLEEQRKLITVVDRQLYFELPETKLHEYIGDSSLVAEVEFAPSSENRDVFAPSMFFDLNFLLSKAKNRQWFQFWGSSLRIARGFLALLANRQSNIVDISIPTSEEVFKTALDNAGYQLILHENKGRYCEGFVQLVGGLKNLEFMRHEYIKPLYTDKDLRNGKVISLKEIYHKTKAGKNRDQLLAELQILLDRHVFIRGYHIPGSGVRLMLVAKSAIRIN